MNFNSCSRNWRWQNHALQHKLHLYINQCFELILQHLYYIVVDHAILCFCIFTCVCYVKLCQLLLLFRHFIIYFEELLCGMLTKYWFFITLHAKLSGTVYCNRSCLWVGLWLCLFVCGSVTMITRNCVHRSSPNWVCR